MREGERGEGRKERAREGERGEGGKESEREGERESSETYTHAHASAFTHIQQADMHTHCVPIILYCIPTLREISVTMRADKVFLMPAQVLGSDTWLQRERETERVGTNRNIHALCKSVCVYVYVKRSTYMLYIKLLRPLITGAAPLTPTMGRRQE